MRIAHFIVLLFCLPALSVASSSTLSNLKTQIISEYLVKLDQSQDYPKDTLLLENDYGMTFKNIHVKVVKHIYDYVVKHDHDYLIIRYEFMMTGDITADVTLGLSTTKRERKKGMKHWFSKHRYSQVSSYSGLRAENLKVQYSCQKERWTQI